MPEDLVQNVHCWSEETDAILCNCFESENWSVYKEAVANLNEHITAITDFKCGEECVPKKLIRTFPNLKL